MLNLKDKNYHPVLQDVLRDFFSDLGGQGIPYVVLRDGQGLPERSGFDIDILAHAAYNQKIEACCRKAAEKYGVLFFFLQAKNRIALFHCALEKSCRNAAILDIQNQVRVGEQLIDIDPLLSSAVTGGFCNRPGAAWDLFLRTVQAVRKNKISDSLRREVERSRSENRGSPLEQYIEDFDRLRMAASLDEWAEIIRAQTGIKAYTKPQTSAQSPLRQLQRFFFKKAFFVHCHNIPFFIVSGPDGVGKTTLIGNIANIFSSFPLQVAHFHHTTLAKNPRPQQANISGEEKEMGILRRWRRKYTPVVIKQLYASFRGEVGYAVRINTEVYDNFYKGCLIFSDRYVYDRAIKMNMLPGKSQIARMATRCMAKAMRKPFLTVIPVDKPENILMRKQELSADQIRDYYLALDKILCAKNNDAVYHLPVEGQNPETLALLASHTILLAMEDVLFSYIGAFEQQAKES